MVDDLESIPTDELIEKAQRTRFEKAILKSGCFAAVLLVVVSWLAVFAMANFSFALRLYVCFMASFIVPFAVFGATKFLAEFRGRHLLRELNRRFGRWTIPAYVRYYQERLESDEIKCLFSGRGLPHGRRYWACIELDESEKLTLQTLEGHGPSREVGNDPWIKTQSSMQEIESEQSEELRRLITNTKGSGKCRISTGVRDGFPAWVAVIFGDGSEATVVSSNLSGLTDVHRQDDRIKLLRLLAKIAGCGRR